MVDRTVRSSAPLCCRIAGLCILSLGGIVAGLSGSSKSDVNVQGLVVVGVTLDDQKGETVIEVYNDSNEVITAYGLSIVRHFSDGRVDELQAGQEFVHILALEDAPADALFQPRTKRSYTQSHSNAAMKTLTSVEAVPLFVLFENGRASGDDAQIGQILSERAARLSVWESALDLLDSNMNLEPGSRIASLHAVADGEMLSLDSFSGSKQKIMAWDFVRGMALGAETAIREQPSYAGEMASHIRAKLTLYADVYRVNSERTQEGSKGTA